MYEKDEEYIKTDMLKDTYDVLLKAHHERKLSKPYSPLSTRQLANPENDETQVQSLTGTSRTEKRQTMKNRPDEKNLK